METNTIPDVLPATPPSPRRYGGQSMCRPAG